MFYPSARVFRKKIIEGVSIPAIIHNANYFFVDLDVYEDGRVYCWNFEDFEAFKKDVQKGWVSTHIPDGEEISIHGLGAWTIKNGKWLFDKRSFIDFVNDLVKVMNPEMKNIFQYTERHINGVRVGENGTGTIFKDSDPKNRLFSERISGNSINLFYRIKDVYHLVKVNVFADDTLQLGRLQPAMELNWNSLEKMISNGDLLTDIPLNASVQIHGLGKFTITETSYVVSIQDKLLELKDILRQLKGEPGSIHICKQAYTLYLEDPTVANKEKLRQAYENVPDHEKMYVGDQDTKDIAVRMIIYGDQEIENWSHYQVAKHMGEKQLPSITVPKPKDE